MKNVQVFGLKENEIFPSLELPINYLSFYDLDKVMGFMSCKENQDKEEFERILFENGIDTSKKYYIEKCLHRPRTSNIPYDGFRVVGSERVDLEWRLSGAASLEAKLFTEDKSLRDELLSLDGRYCKHDQFEDDGEVSSRLGVIL